MSAKSIEDSLASYIAASQPNSFTILLVDGGLFFSHFAGLAGLTTKFPPQLGQTSFKISLLQDLQNVHSKVHIIASVLFGGRSFPQHSQHGLSSNINIAPQFFSITKHRMTAVSSHSSGEWDKLL